MIKRHEDQLWARLDELYANGTTFISWGELYHWFDAQRLAKAPWRDIRARWEELLEQKNEKYYDPQIAKVGGGISLFYAKVPEKLSDWAD
jgi:predicted P-loop ATPase